MEALLNEITGPEGEAVARATHLTKRPDVDAVVRRPWVWVARFGQTW